MKTAWDTPPLAKGFTGLRKKRGVGASPDPANDTEIRAVLLPTGLGFAILGIFTLLAVLFRSYIQAVLVMVSILFGLASALAGHIIMGFDLSIISIFGMIALCGIVINGGLVLVVTANRMRDSGTSSFQAAIDAGSRRFRPILLTALTTFFGLAPMIFETSVQARFLVPMAISLGYGILFSTFIILILIPALYVIHQDIDSFFRK